MCTFFGCRAIVIVFMFQKLLLFPFKRVQCSGVQCSAVQCSAVIRQTAQWIARQSLERPLVRWPRGGKVQSSVNDRKTENFNFISLVLLII